MCWHESGVPPQNVLLPKLALASEILLQEIAVLKQNTENEDNPDESVKKLIDEESGAPSKPHNSLIGRPIIGSLCQGKTLPTKWDILEPDAAVVVYSSAGLRSGAERLPCSHPMNFCFRANILRASSRILLTI